MKRYQQSAHALGSDALLTLVVPKSAAPDEVFAKLWDHIAEFEKQFSRFLPDSELSTFNQQAGQLVPVTPPFYALLTTAKELSRKTGGLYNPFILPSLQKAGYVGSWPTPNVFKKQLNYSQRASNVKIEQLLLQKNAAHIPANTALDFGGCGKGYLLDELADLLDAHGIKNYWLSLGGDIVCNGHDVTNKSWKIAVQSATDPRLVAQYIDNNGARIAVATSGISKRHGTNNGAQWHHIIDPRTQLPATTDIVTATVSTTKAVKADVFAKCLVILGSKDSQKFLAKHHLTNVLLQKQGDKKGTPCIAC